MIIVAIPAYNEEAALGVLLDGIQADLQEAGYGCRILVVDDGSSDGTATVVTEKLGRLPVRLIQHETNRGLAAAVRTGLLAALEEAAPRDIIVTMDGDNTHPPGLIVRMVRTIREGCDVVIASRYQPGSRVLGVPAHRQMLSWGAGLLFRATFPIAGVKDYTCGYRAYRAGILQQAAQEFGEGLITEDGFACMVELLLRMRQSGAVMAEVPMILRYDRKQGKSKMNVRKTVQQTLKLLARERVRGKGSRGRAQ
jgi:dolichol-phosphate mannosyltransferase